MKPDGHPDGLLMPADRRPADFARRHHHRSGTFSIRSSRSRTGFRRGAADLRTAGVPPSGGHARRRAGCRRATLPGEGHDRRVLVSARWVWPCPRCPCNLLAGLPRFGGRLRRRPADRRSAPSSPATGTPKVATVKTRPRRAGSSAPGMPPRMPEHSAPASGRRRSPLPDRAALRTATHPVVERALDDGRHRAGANCGAHVALPPAARRRPAPPPATPLSARPGTIRRAATATIPVRSNTLIDGCRLVVQARLQLASEARGRLPAAPKAAHWR